MNRATPAHYFDALYLDDDPFGYRNSWYEVRKRALLMASLPAQQVGSAWEIGCSNGELTAALAARCTHLLATDLSARAVALAQRRNAAAPHVEIRRAEHPADWPEQAFDLVVLSEVGYYLDRPTLLRLIRRLRNSLHAHGSVVACHWRAPFAEAPLAGDDVHALIHDAIDMPAAFSYVDADLRLESWSLHPDSIAQREGLR